VELLESDGARPRQARYQAALRPDKLSLDSTLICKFASTPIGPTVPPLYQNPLDSCDLAQRFMKKSVHK